MHVKFFCESLDKLNAVVGRAIVHDNNLEVLKRLQFETFQAFDDKILRVVHGDYYRYFRKKFLLVVSFRLLDGFLNRLFASFVDKLFVKLGNALFVTFYAFAPRIQIGAQRGNKNVIIAQIVTELFAEYVINFKGLQVFAFFLYAREI